MAEDGKSCEHDFLAVLHCKKCGEQYHTNWLDAVMQAKLDAVAEVLQRIKTTISVGSIGKNKKEAKKIALDALEEVKKVYEKSMKKQDQTNLDNLNQIKISRLLNSKK